MNTQSPFHAGELKVQKLAKESDIAQRNGSIISNIIPPGAIPFVGQQLMVVVSSLDDDGNIWASVLIGNPGFITAPDPSSLLLDTTNILSHASDPLWENIESHPHIGVLVIELSTRRRETVIGCLWAI